MLKYDVFKSYVQVFDHQQQVVLAVDHKVVLVVLVSCQEVQDHRVQERQEDHAGRVITVFSLF